MSKRFSTIVNNFLIELYKFALENEHYVGMKQTTLHWIQKLIIEVKNIHKRNPNSLLSYTIFYDRHLLVAIKMIDNMKLVV